MVSFIRHVSFILVCILGALSLTAWAAGLFITISGMAGNKTYLILSDGTLIVMRASSIRLFVQNEGIKISRNQSAFRSTFMRSVSTVGHVSLDKGFVGLTLPLWWLFITSGGAAALIHHFRSTRIDSSFGCSVCGYDLRACLSERCPECGSITGKHGHCQTG